MGSEWRTVRLGDVAEDLTVGHVGSMAAEYVAEGVPFLRSQNVQPFRLELSDVKYISAAFHEKLRKSALRGGDVVIVRTGKPGTAAVIPDTTGPLNCSDLVIVRPSAQLDPNFLCYFINGVAQHHVDSRLVGAVQQHFNVGAARELPLSLPTIAEQRAIARILGALDDKIELNRKTNETLEAMARALFKSWFVDFDPVRAKAEGRAPSGMDAETAKLFPSEFVESELGLIPKGWRSSTLGPEVERAGGGIQTGPFGSQLHASDYVPEGVPVVMPKDLVGRRVSEVSIARVREADARRLSRHRLEAGDVVYSRRGDVERHALIGEREVGWLCGTGCLLIRLGKRWRSSAFASFALDRPETRAWIVQHAIGATMPNLNTGILSAVPLLMPPDDILMGFSRVVDPLQQLVERTAHQSTVLVQTRDALLPRLLSDELWVATAARDLEASP